MLQDRHYLMAFSRALAAVAARAPDDDAVVRFAGSAQGAVLVERRLHEGFLRKLGVAPEEAEATEPSPTCLNYANFLLATSLGGPWEAGLAAVLPCFRIYWEVGRRLDATAAPDNPYRAWIDAYADEAFAASVRSVLAIADAAHEAAEARRRREMLEAFVRSARFEWMFWDSAWRREDWPIR